LHNRPYEPSPVVVLAVVEAILLFDEVAMQVRVRKVRPGSAIAPLEQCPIVLKVIGMDRSPDILLKMIDGLVCVVGI